MKKKKSIRNYIFAGIASVICLILCIFSFPVPFTNYIFNGFIKGTTLSLDIDGGTGALYNVTGSNYFDGTTQDAVDTAINRIQFLISKYYQEGEVVQVNDNQIKIIVPDTTVSDNLTLGIIEMKSTEGEPTYQEDELLVTGKHIKSIKYQLNSDTHGVMIEFTDEGKELFRQLTAQVAATSSQTMYIYMDKDYTSAFSSPTVSEENNYGYTFISGSGLTSKKATDIYVEKLISSMYGVNMIIDGEEYYVAPTYGENANIISLLITIFTIALIFGIFIFLYRDFGLLASLSMVFNFAFIIALISCCSVYISVGGVVAINFAFVFSAICHMIILENIKNEYSKGKKLNPSIRDGYKKALFTNLDLYAIVGCVSALLYLISTSLSKSISIILLFTIVSTALSALAIFRGLLLNYLGINTSNGKRLNFKKEIDNESK